MSDDPTPRLSELLDTLTDATIDVLDAGVRDGWSPATVDHALGVVDIPVAAAQHGGPLATALEPLPALTATARRALSEDPPPAPRPGAPAARAEAADGTAAYRAWWEARQYFPPLQAEPSAVTVQRAAYERAAATKIITRDAARTAARARRDLADLWSDATTDDARRRSGQWMIPPDLGRDHASFREDSAR